MGITGNSQGHKRPIQQFNTPGLPYVMIGTDTIREVVNLHLFCDRAMYYGVDAWRSGTAHWPDQPLFQQIERRLIQAGNGAEAPLRLEVHYPY
ncbi:MULTISPECIES: hypothetical protein [Pseudomonas]|uniref:Uncharacterized protein n=1 Tax=Pseudomonas veronii TaxID=76761 RepID=A0A7Y0ZZ55_PSEVE|nr:MULTISPECIES: hypothetical protein [Pseudomonas]MBH3423651.1 hypothetical protein [Pseudomonas gessardii]MBJ2261967.1 hypothetical protein [Pseudomonas sp. MF6787]NMY00738.1 hypothetical protein [Pseudomonas veronii]SEC69931.1 hypothetical protein SAMN04490199_5406 [Pseudomonas marginalis]